MFTSDNKIIWENYSDSTFLQTYRKQIAFENTIRQKSDLQNHRQTLYKPRRKLKSYNVSQIQQCCKEQKPQTYYTANDLRIKTARDCNKKLSSRSTSASLALFPRAFFPRAFFFLRPRFVGAPRFPLWILDNTKNRKKQSPAELIAGASGATHARANRYTHLPQRQQKTAKGPPPYLLQMRRSSFFGAPSALEDF